jgi:hypothetical protein
VAGSYLPMAKAEANDWSVSHWYITIFCDNFICDIISLHFVSFQKQIFGNTALHYTVDRLNLQSSTCMVCLCINTTTWSLTTTNLFSLTFQQLTIGSGICYPLGIKSLKSKIFTTQCLAFLKGDKRHDIRFTKQISVTRISNLSSKFHFSFNVLLIF